MSKPKALGKLLEEGITVKTETELNEKLRDLRANPYVPPASIRHMPTGTGFLISWLEHKNPNSPSRRLLAERLKENGIYAPRKGARQRG